MIRGFSGPPDPHLLHREPLRVDELDPQVIRGMTGFEFGTEEEIERRLVAILESDAYHRAVQLYERKRDPGGRNGTLSSRWGESVSNSSLATSLDGSTLVNKSDVGGLPLTPTKKNRRFSGFDFYRRKLFAGGSSPPGTPLAHSPSTSQSHLAHPLSVEYPMDPTKGFHPLISMYYLAREKMERERVYGPGHFASSQLSLQERAGTVPVPMTSVPMPIAGRLDYNMPLPRLPIPETTHYSGMSYNSQTVTPSTPSPTAQQGQPRARDAGPGTLHPPAQSGPRDVVSAPSSPVRAGLPRAPPASTHRRSHSLSQRPTGLRGLGGMFGGGDVDAVGYDLHAPRSAGPALGSTSEERIGEREVDEEGVLVEKDGEEKDKDEDHQRTITPAHSRPTSATGAAGVPQMSTGATLVRRFGSLLVGGRGVEEGSKRVGMPGKRATILGFSPRPSISSAPATEKEKSVGELLKEEEEEKQATETDQKDRASLPEPTMRESQSTPIGNLHRRAATILDPPGRSPRHERRSSTGGNLFSVGTIGRYRRPNTAGGSGRPVGEKVIAKTDEEDEGRETEPKSAEIDGGERKEAFREEDERHTNEKDFKPVFLKGLFRYVWR
jgi:serine/threonine protein kinase KIN1/2